MFRNTTFTRATLALALFGAVVLTCLAAPAPPAARLTIADGAVQVLRGAARFDAVEGTALSAEDIVRTAAGTRVARIEFADGRVLDLGPATQVLLLPPPLEGIAAVLAQGWAKLGVGGDGLARLAAPTVRVEVGGSALVRSDADGSVQVFAESRAARVVARQAMAFPAATLREGESWTRDAGVHRTPPQAVPRALADALPRRAARFAGFDDTAPDGAEPLEAADLAPWLRAEPALIAQLRPRLTAMVRRSATAAPPRSAARGSAPVRSARPDPRKTRESAIAMLRANALPLKSVAHAELLAAPSPLPPLSTERVAAIAALPVLSELSSLPAAASASAPPPARNAKKRSTN